MNNEPKWKKIEGYDYSVSDRGDVRNDKTGAIKSARVTKCGYLLVNLYCKGSCKSFTVHRLVAAAFVPNPLNKEQVNHINGNKADNRAENLEWATPSENQQHRYRVLKKAKTTWNIEAAVNATHKSIRCRDNGKVYKSVTEAAKDNGLTVSSLSMCLTGKNKTCGGRHWEYVQ